MTRIKKDNLTLIGEQFEKLKGQYVLSHCEAYRLVGIVDDDFDYYYCLYDGRELHLVTCLAGLIPLKGYLRKKDYNELVRMAKLNHYDQPTLWGNTDYEEIKELNAKHKEELTKDWGPQNKFIFGPYWYLN